MALGTSEQSFKFFRPFTWWFHPGAIFKIGQKNLLEKATHPKVHKFHRDYMKVVFSLFDLAEIFSRFEISGGALFKTS